MGVVAAVVVDHVSSELFVCYVWFCPPGGETMRDKSHTDTHSPPRTYLAFTAHLVALAQALLLGVAQGVPGHDVITQGHMHAPAGLGLACRRIEQR